LSDPKAGLPDFALFIEDFRHSISSVALLEKGWRVFKYGIVYGGSLDIYTVPEAKTAYVYYVSYACRNYSSTTTEICYVIFVVGGSENTFIREFLAPNALVSRVVWGGVAKLIPGDIIRIHASVNAEIVCNVHILEF